MHDTSLPWVRLRSFWLLNFPLFCLLLLSYGTHIQWNHGWFIHAYFSALSIAQAGMASAVFLIYLPWLLYWLACKKIPLSVWAVGLASLSLFLFSLDRFIYSQFHTHFDITILSMILSPARSQIFDLSWLDYGSLIIALLVIMTVEIMLYRRIIRTRPNKITAVLCLSGIIAVCLLGVQFTYAWADAVYEPSILLTSELAPGFYGMTAKRFFTQYQLLDVSRNRPEQLKTNTNAGIHYPSKTLEIKTLVNKPNILIVALDAWRYDSLNLETTPKINQFAQISSRYHQHYSGGNSTRAGIFSLFYGVNPGDFDAFYRGGVGPVLFEVLYRQGYQVGAFPSASALSPPFHRTTFVNVKDFQPVTNGETSIERDRAVTKQLKSFTRRAHDAQQPFFAFIFYDSAHAYNYPSKGFIPPFQPSAKVAHLSLQNKKQKQLYFNQYRNSLYFLDALVGEVLSDLKTKGILDNTIVIITGDHGEEFDDNGLGYWGHNGNFTPAQTQVPLIVHWPHQGKREEFQHVTSHYDISATLLSQILGVTNSISDYGLGKRLNDPAAREIILMGSYGKMAIFSPTQSLIAVTNRLGMFHAEDLHGTPDPNQELDGELFKLAFTQMNQFHTP
jgi:membrane-anchored protein YejM (alkaline phosphatase superfamily)